MRIVFKFARSEVEFWGLFVRRLWVIFEGIVLVGWWGYKESIVG